MAYPLDFVSPPFSPLFGYYLGYGPHPATVEADGTVRLKGEHLRFTDPEPPYPAGTALQVTQTLGGTFRAESQADYERGRQAAREAHDQLQQLREEARLSRERQRQRAVLEQAEQVRLPVRWEAAIKDVLSGLSARSNGDGMNARSVYHVRLLEDFAAGRIKRKKGHYLCTSPKGSNGQNYANGDAEVDRGSDGALYPALITCKRCLQLLQPYRSASTPA